MDKNKLKQIIAEQREYFFSKKNLIPRESQKVISTYIKQREVIVISGIRRSGKSSLLRLICDDIINHYCPIGH